MDLHFNQDDQFFKEFTFSSIQKIKENMKNERIRLEIEKNDIEMDDSDCKNDRSREKTRHPDKDFQADEKLPRKYRFLFPKNIFGKPLEELDEFYKCEYVFIVINSNYQIYRFSATKSLSLVMLTILANCFIMALPASSVPEFTEIVFTLIYTFEAFLKIIARGFCMKKFTFLRDPWNWLDFIVLILAYTTLFIKSLGNLSVLRTLRVLRALKTVAIVPGLKTIVDSLIQSLIRLRDVVILTSFVLSVFSLIGLQLYMGSLKRKCVINGPSNMTKEKYSIFISDKENWMVDGNDKYILCGNSSGAMNCPNGSVCLPNIGDNPNNGYTNFDSYGYAMLSSFRLMTQDYWEDLYQLILTAEGPYQVFFFISVIFFGSFYLINLILAIVALSYKDQQIRAIEEANLKEEKRKAEECEELENCIIDSEEEKNNLNFSISFNSLLYSDIGEIFNDKNVQLDTCSRAERFNSIDSQITWDYTSLKRKNKLNSNECKNDSSIFYVDESNVSQGSEKIDPQIQIFSKKLLVSKFEKTNKERLNEAARKYSVFYIQRKRTDHRKKISQTFYMIFCSWECLPKYNKIKKIVGFLVLDPFFDLFITICIIFNTLFLALDHHNMNQNFSETLTKGNYIFIIIFATEAILKLIALKPSEYIKSRWNLFDLLIVVVSVTELFLASKKMMVLRSFRLLRVFKLAKSWSTLNKLMCIIGETIGALGNLVFVLGIIIFIFAVMGNQLFGFKYIENRNVWNGEIPRWNFVDFFHSFLIVFRVLCGEWIESMWDCMEAIEDKKIHSKPILKNISNIMDKFFTYAFAVEVLLKWMAHGFKKYFSDGWCWLDFTIALVSLGGLTSSLLGVADIPAFKTMRTLRALRPLRALSRFEGIRVVVNALIGSIPSIFNVLLVCLVFWLVFSIMGVQLFAGKFYKCVYPNMTRVPYEEVKNLNDCNEKNYTWVNSKINFDNVKNAYLALLQVATFKGWIEIMADAADMSHEINQQPRREQSIYMLLYFVFFIIFGSFFTLNLFIGVIIDNFNQQKKKNGNEGTIDVFMTKEQKKYYNAMKKMEEKKPQKALPRPRIFLARLMFDVTSNQKFDIFIMICIFLNMLAMCAESYQQSDQFVLFLSIINQVFITIFTAECVMKLIALNWRFFKFPWNIFDMTIVILSILGMIFEEFMKHVLTFSPTILRVVRVVRIGRILRLVKGARGIRTLLFALAISMPALINIGLLLLLVIFIYAIFGMFFFMYVKYDAGLNELFNFENIYRSMITLFPLCTSAGWASVLKALTNDHPPDCDPTVPTLSQISKGNCSNSTIAIPYLISYLVISFLVVVNMYIAVILENFSQAREEVQQGLTNDDYDMYYEVWQRFDPDCTEFISYDKIFDFVDSLEKPLRIEKPNRLKLISLNLTICEKNLVHCVDILDALTKNYLGTPQEIQNAIPLNILKKDRPNGYKPITTTLKVQREKHCAKIVAQVLKNHLHDRKKSRLKLKLGQRLSIEDFTIDDSPVKS
ncbi:sodium channel para isoform X6 [Brachionus plicatilis]|uniref:Sodium channel protein n=1 Tax=Brachionus plicatilis TaxID=10195 RepID=A0A3M7P5C0_BRAPC|nr:sodium channel para isoform X6 [Brachionus plicatilis]